MSDTRIPCTACLAHVVKHALTVDKPVMLDYWKKSVTKQSFIGLRETGEKLLVKNEEEYTSPIAKIFKVETDYIVETENSIYLVCAGISSKRIS